MLQSNTSFTLLSKINITDTTGGTFTISNENENDTPIDTDGEQVSIVFSNKRQRERLIVTIVNNVCTIVSRGLSQKGGAESTTLQKQWLEGTVGYMTALDFDIFEKDSGETQIVSADAQFDGNVQANTISTTGSNYRIRKDGNDMKFRDDNQSEVSLSSLAAASGSDEKIKISNNDTTAGYLNGKLVAGDGIRFTENNDGLNETLDIDVDVTDTTTFSTDGAADRVVVTDGSGNIFQATTTKRGGAEIATTAESLALTDDTKIVTPSKLGEVLHSSGTLQTQGGASTTTTSWTFTPTNSVIAYIELNATNKFTYNETYFEEYNGSTYDVITSLVVSSNETLTTNFVMFLKGGTQYRLRRNVDVGRGGYAYARYIA